MCCMGGLSCHKLAARPLNLDEPLICASPVGKVSLRRGIFRMMGCPGKGVNTFLLGGCLPPRQMASET